ncbi:M16 family metallopeptidase [Calothrix sp. PCC 6303]|uniref:M16 family metallopeptidase n=1 Tax=Calothrix sp. PCC 6303 TaxID=1170562 RepID=UPI0002A03E77|nr:pitrilysin family protein [Calothrix sp. PCC 6303]AFZ04504.1 processing peptidase [Calothrix sp. PCC 6303]
MTSTLTKLPRLNTPKLHRLPSGLTIVAEQMPLEAVNLSLWLNVGSRVEPDTINGMAHFLEHMIFKGTERLVSGEFERRIEERGAVTNAATSQDYTHYYITTAPQDFAELAPLHIELVNNPSIRDEAFERERLVVLEEIRRSEDSPQRRIFQWVMDMAFERLPYRRSVLGPEAVISQLQPQQMRDFHAGWYQPSSMTAVAVGNLPVEELIEIVSAGFADATKHKQPGIPHQEIPSYPEPAFTEVVRQEYVDETIQQARLTMLWRVPGLENLDETYALDVLSGILGQGRTSRLVSELREDLGLVSYVSASNMSFSHQGIFLISTHCDVENLEIVEEKIIQHLRTLQTEIVKASEIDRVCKQVANRFIFGNETPSDRANLYGYYQSLMGDLEPAMGYVERMRSQNATNLLKSVQKYLSPDAYGVVIVKPKP